MKRLGLFLLVLTMAAAPAAAQQPVPALGSQQPPPRTVFRSGANLVALNVTVTDGEEFVRGLQSDDFAVYEDGVQQRVRFFESTGIPMDLILLVDASSSMRDKIELVHDAAMGFLDSLREMDRGAVVAFSDRVDVVQPLTSDRAALEAAVRGTEAMGGTSLHNALYIALKQFGQAARTTGDVRRQAIAVLSDGKDTSSLLSFDDVLQQARRSGVSIYTIALRSSHSVARDQPGYFSESDYAMRTLAQETGAQAFFPSHIRDLKAIYASIADEVSNQYSIGYAPTNTRADGQFRRIVVRVTSRPELKPRARSGYLAVGANVPPAEDTGRPRIR